VSCRTSDATVPFLFSWGKNSLKFQKQDKEHRLHKPHGKKKRSNITAIVMMIYNEIHDVFRLVAWE
jgi:hypothetical protein